MNFLRLPLIAIVVILTVSCSSRGKYDNLQNALSEYADSCNAEVGIAVIIDGKDTVTVNCDKDYPMMSVFKFPQALAVANYAENHAILLDDSIDIRDGEILPDTYSPMRERYGTGALSLPLHELLAFSLQHSDNNACDILFRLIGGPATAQHYLDSIGITGINIVATEADMHADTGLCYENYANPLAMAGLLEIFSTAIGWQSPAMHTIFNLMTTCATGDDRLAAPLSATNATIGHKTGTGDKNANGEIIGLNDVGFVFLPNGHRYCIAVFIKDSKESPQKTSAMIARISEIVYQALNEPEK
ncbi:MAG: class A beta-lactamase [Bacteroides sp.]|nr:class A beta-lactamase [Bacteroides sp.]MCM1388899.1 class A beta-lactamase [Bacteroides sp.]